MKPSSPKPYLSKSRLISAWQCSKKLYLSVHHPELAEADSGKASLFALGHQVGELAQQIFGAGAGVEIPYSERLQDALDKTAELIGNGYKQPIYEATFQHDGVLVRVDVLLPVEGGGWRAIEVKAGAGVKPQYEIDCAIQYWVLMNTGLDLKSLSLAYVNTGFVYQGDGNYQGLLAEADMTATALQLQDEVIDLVNEARTVVTGEMPDVPVGAHCYSPYECNFMAQCWPMDAEYPVMGLGGRKKDLASWVNAGCRDVRDVDIDELGFDRKRLRIHAVTSKGEAEISAEAKREIDELAYPRYYLDFETVAPAVPVWAGMRPYHGVPVQWSCHIDHGPPDRGAEAIRHHEFLDLSGEPPMRKLAESLIGCLGATGPVFMYTDYERRVINGLADRFPDLAAPLGRIIARLVDLCEIVKKHYYHPKMLGSWSLKAVSPTVDPEMDYSMLTGIAEGMAASDGYLEAINPATTPERKAELEEQLLRYCRLDTEVMVKIVHTLTKS